MDFDALKARRRKAHDNHQPNLALFVRKVRSWLGRANKAEDEGGRWYLGALGGSGIWSRLVFPELTAYCWPIVLNRLRVLYSQLMPIGTTCNLKLNRYQQRGCLNFLCEVVPMIIAIIPDSGYSLRDEVCFQVVKAR